VAHRSRLQDTTQRRRPRHRPNRSTNLAAPWHGITVSKLPATGGGFYNQQNYLKYEYSRDQVMRQIADNVAKQYQLSHHMSGAWLKHILLQDKATLNAQNQAARKSMAQKHALAKGGGGGAAGNVVPVRLIDRCKAEERNEKHHAATSNHTKATARHTSVLPAMFAILQKIHAKIDAGSSPHHHAQDRSRLIGVHTDRPMGF
jgi:hypothetical protein